MPQDILYVVSAPCVAHDLCVHVGGSSRRSEVIVRKSRIALFNVIIIIIIIIVIFLLVVVVIITIISDLHTTTMETHCVLVNREGETPAHSLHAAIDSTGRMALRRIAMLHVAMETTAS